MPTDKIKDVYDLISDKGYFTDENEFRSYVNDPKKIKEVYSLIQDDGFFKDEKEFEGYFSDVKKKEPAIGLGYEKPSEALRMGGLPKQEKLSQSPLKIAATTTPSVSTKKQWTQQDQKSLIEKIKNGDLTGQTPEEDDYLSRIGNRIVRGMNTLNYNLSKTPEFVYNLAAYPQNVIAETFDIPALAASADKVKQELGIQNEVADYYKDQINQLASLDDKYMGAKGSVTTLAKEGKYLDAAKLLGEQIAESLPTTAAIAASGGLGASSTAITLGGGAVFGAAKYDELADRTDLTESQKTSISFATGLTEGLFENLGTGNIGRIVKDVITKQGAAQGKEVAKGMFVTAYKDALKKYMPVSGALSEGIEEAGTQFAQNAIDIYTGVDPQKKLTDGLIDAFAVGTGSGLVISSPALLSKDRNKKVAEKQVEVDEIDSEINNPNLSDDAKATLAQKRGKIMSDINDVIDEDVNEQRALPDATKREIEQIQDGLEQIGIDIENTKSEFAKKELESKRVELESRIDELTKAGTTTTDGERTIEGAVSTGTDVAKEGLGVAAEPGKEGVAGEDIQAEKVRKEVVEAFGDDAKDLEDFYYESKRNGTNKEFVDEYESMFPPKETQQKIEIEKSNEIEKESNNKIINGEADPIVSKIVSEHTFTDEDNNLIDKERGDLDRDSFINKKIKEIISGSKLVSDKIKKALAPIVDKLKKIIIGISIVSSVGVGKQVSSYQPINNIISEKISSDIANVVKMPYSDIANIGTNAIQKFLEIGDYADTESTLGLETSVDMTGVKESNIPSIGEKDVIIGEATSTTKDSKYKIKPYIINLLSDSVKIKLADNKFKKNRKPFKDQKNSLGIMGSTNGIILFKEASDYQKSLGIQMVYDEKTSKIVPKMNSDVAPNDIVFLTSEGIAIPIDDLDMKPNNNGGFDIKKGKDNENGTAILLKKDGNSFHIGWAAKADEAPSFVSTEKAKEFKILRGGMVWLYSTDGEVAVAVSGSLNDIFSEYKRLQEKNPNKKFILFRGDTGSYSTPAFTETNETTADDVSKYSTRNTYGNNVHLVLMKPDAPLDKGLPVGEMGLSPLLALALLKRKKGLSITKEEQDLIDNREKQKQYETKKETPTAEKTVTTTDVSEDLKDVESTAKALEEAVKSNPILSKDLSENDNVVYHGTGAEVLLDFIKTDKEKTYQEKSTSWSKSTQGFGKFWTKSKDNASSHIDHRLRNDGTGTVVHAVYASKNPFKVKDVSTLITKSKEHWASIGGDKNALASTINKAYKDKLIKDGYDAITFKEGTSQMPTSRKFAADVFVPLKDFPIQVATQEYGSRNAGAVSDVKINYNQISEAYQADKAANKETPLTKTVEKILGQPKAEAKPTEAAKVEPAKETAKPTKTERKVIAEAKIDDLAAKAKEFLRNKNLPEGTQVSGVSQDKVIDILASTVKALVNSGIEISEAIKQVREYFEQDFDTSGIKDYEIAQAIARDELTDAAKENGFSSYREAVFAVNKYVREVGKEDVITKAEIEKAKEAKDKEAEAPKKGYTSKKKQAQEGEKEPVIKETGRSKSYEEGRVPVSEAYNDVVNAQKEYYEQMNRKEELANAEGYLASFGNTEEGLLDAYIDMMEVFRTNPYLDPKNSIAIEILADRMFAMAIDYRDKGQTDKYNNFLEKSEKLRKEAFQAHFRAGQYTSAVAVFSRSANPDAFLIFVEGQQAQEFEKAKKSKPEKIKEYEAAVNDFYEKAKEIKKDAARQAVVSAPNSTTKVNVKLSDKLKARYEQGKARQAEALKKLGKINFFGSSGLSNEAIEAVGELVLSQFEQGIYKAATIIERIIEITEGKLTEKNIKDVYDAYKVNYKGEKLTLTELEEVLRKEEIAEKEPATDIDKALEKEREKLAKIKADYEQAVVDKADALVLKRAQQFVKDQEKKVKEQEDKAKKAATAKTAEGKRPTLSDLIQRELEADSTKEQIAKELVEKGGLSEREANKLAEIYYNKYRKILKEKITSQLLKDLTPKKVKQIEAQMNALKDKPYGKTLGGMIANQVAAGALDSEILRAAFAEKYGLPNISPVQADIIRDLARKARAAKTQLGLQTANKNLLEYVNSFVKPKYGSLLGTLYYMGLLTGVSTAAVNTFGNVNGLINQSTENFVQSVIEAIQGNKGNLMSSSKPAQKILMAIANMNDSLSAAIDILIHGGGESRYSNIKKDAFGEITTEDLIVKRKDFKDLGFKKLFTTLFKLYKTPPALFIRNLPASDEGFTMANFNMEATRELRKKLYAEGYRGADLEKKVYEQVYGTTEIKAKALQEAIKELKRIGIDPANRKILANRIAKEIIANSLDEKVQNVANEVAKENTFRGKPRGMAGYLSRKIPQTWLISPFVTTPSRILEKHMNYIPLYGILRYYRGGISDTLRKAFPGLEKDFVRKGIESSKREGELRNKQLAQVLATHALLLVFWGLSQIDWEDEKGNVVPFVDASAGYMGTDIEERKRLEELMPAYMIRIGNFKFSYKTNPLLAMIALPLGVIKDAERSFETADYSKSAFAYNFELFNFLYESNPIEGYQDFFEGLSKSFRTIKEEMTLESIAALPVKVAADFSSNVAVDNFYKQIVDFTDPLVHEAQDLMEVIYKAFNMEKIGDLTPTHDRWGRPVKRYPGESFFPLQHLFNNNDDKKITEWEIKNGIEIPTINRKTLVLTNNTLKTEKQIKNQREELVKDYGLTSDEVKYFDEALNSDFKLLTKDEWNKMSETIRYDVFTIIKNNFDNATEEYKKFYKESINSEERNIKPISKLSRPDAKKLVEILFKIKKREYINNNFTKIE